MIRPKPSWRVVGLTAMTVSLACAEKKPVPNGEIQPIAHIQLDSNRAVEVIGLRWWAADALRDSLNKYSPGEGLDSPNLAVNLRSKLHFADAGVHSSEQVFDENETVLLTVAVREPRDSARVHYVPQRLDSAARILDWKGIATRLAGEGNAHLLAVVAARQVRGLPRTIVDSSVKPHPVTTPIGYAFETPEDSVAARPLLDAIGTRTTDRDLSMAIQTIDMSTSLPDRVAAALILSNFPQRDEAWRALVKAAVGQQQAADADVARQVLGEMAERFPRHVDWTPVASIIHDALEGTAVMSLPAISGALARTGATPANAKAWLAGGGEMLVAYIESTNAELSEPAHRLLIALRGSDLGGDVETWRAWIRTL